MANSVLYGLLNQADLAGELTSQSLVAPLDPDLLIATTLETVAQHNAEMDALRGLFAGDTLDYQKFFRGAIGGDLQEGDENSDPEPVKGYSKYTVGFPLREAKHKWGANYTTLQQMTLQDDSDRTDQALLADVNWHRKWMLGTLLFNGTDGAGATGTLPYTFTDPVRGAVSVYGLANGDATTYDKVGSTTLATDNHYTAQNGAISDVAGQNPFPTIETALLEHPINTGDVVSFIAPGLASTVTALADFVPAPRVMVATPGDDTPVAPADFPIALPPSARFIGTIGQTYVATWRTVPANTIVSRTTQGGPPPLLYRQYPVAALQGFGPIDYAAGKFGNKFPYFAEVWYRAGGYGSWNRVGAHVHQVGSSTTYAMSATYYPLFGRSS